MRLLRILTLLGLSAMMGSACAAGTIADSARTARETHTGYGEFYQQRATLFDVLPVSNDAIVMLGNSLTNGCEWHELLNNPKVISRGITGDIVQGIHDRLQPVLDGRPAKIFLLVGVNDVSHDLTADSIATALQGLIHRIRTATPGTRLYVQSLLPINNSFGRYKRIVGKEQVIRDINARLRPIAEEEGATYIDLYDTFADSEGNLRSDLTNDGLHLLGPAYLLWRDRLLPYLCEPAELPQ